MHPKDLRCVSKRKLLDVVQVLSDCLEDGDVVALIEVEGRLEYGLVEPELVEGEERVHKLSNSE